MPVARSLKRSVLGTGTAVAALMAMAVPVIAQSATPQPAFSLQWSNQRLLKADNEPGNWLMQGHNVQSHRYSSLTQINRENVNRLHMAYAISLGGANDVAGPNGPNIMATPLVDNGIMYTISSWGRVFKLDVRNPKQADLIWISDPQIEHEGNDPQTRGIALYGTSIINPLRDGRLVAIDRDSGEILWDKQMAVTTEYGGQERFNAAPLCIEDKCMVSNATGDGGTRGWLAAVDPKTGEEIWRTYVVPAPGEPGSETWQDTAQTAWTRGGGGMWTTGSYDPVNRNVIWGTGNPVPSYDPEFRPGDNLFTDSTIAFDIDTGKMNWYFQLTPNDGWDYDENGVNFVFDAPINGEMVHQIGHFGRNGFYYNWNAADGSYINGSQWVNELTWTKGLDPKTGKPLEYDPTLAVQTYVPETRNLREDFGTVVTTCPTWHGGTAHQPPAYNPVKYIAYTVSTEGCFSQDLTKATVVDPPPPAGQGTLKDAIGAISDLYYGAITAVDVRSGEVIAKVNVDEEIRSGMLATAGGLVFTALTNGDFVALNDETLEQLWSFNLGTPLKAPPMTFAVNGRQYVALQTSGLHVHPKRFTDLMHSEYLFVFALDN